MLPYYYVSFSLGSELGFEELQEQPTSMQEGVYTSDFKAFGLVGTSSDKRHLFQVSVTHGSDDRPRTSKPSEKPAHFARAPIQNGFTISEQPWRSNAKATVSTALLVVQSIKSQGIITSSRAGPTVVLNKSISGHSR